MLNYTKRGIKKRLVKGNIDTLELEFNVASTVGSELPGFEYDCDNYSSRAYEYNNAYYMIISYNSIDTRNTEQREELLLGDEFTALIENTEHTLGTPEKVNDHMLYVPITERGETC